MMALTLATQAAAGLPVWDTFPVSRPLSVVYLDMELSRGQIQRRLRQFALSAKMAGKPLAKKSIHVATVPDGLDLSMNNVNGYIKALREYEPDVIIIDPFYKLTSVNISDEKETKPVLFALDAMRVDLNCALVVCHHLRKSFGGETRGSSQSDMFGSSVLLRWNEAELRMRDGDLIAEKDRNHNWPNEGGVGKKRWRVKWGGKWQVSIAEVADPTRESVLDAVKVFGPVSANKIIETTGGRREAVLATIKTLHNEGSITRNGKGWDLP